MAESEEEKVEELLQRGLSKADVAKRLGGRFKKEKLDFYLENIAYPKDRRRYQFWNLSLVAILVFITLKKLYFALSFGALSLTMLLAMVVPVINLYLLREIMRFRKLGYQFLAVLSMLSLVNAENRAYPEIILVPIMAGLSAFLYLEMFYLRTRKRKALHS